jgi:predicted acylesterase/phospholipase RssA
MAQGAVMAAGQKSGSSSQKLKKAARYYGGLRNACLAMLILACLAYGAHLSLSLYYDRRVPPEGVEMTVASIPDRPGVRFWGDEVPGDLATAVRRWTPHMPNLATSAALGENRARLVTYLALSGGGSDGAFGAGLLAGWSKSGKRPNFEVVTGVSAGALIAPFAFLGSDYDGAMREVWTRYSTKEIAPQRLTGFLGAPSLSDTTPLKRILMSCLDDRFLARIAAEYMKGRMLLVVTTNLDAQRPVVWNLGEIASSSSPNARALIADVLLASSAVPGLFPPVNIAVREPGGRTYEELHADGGITREVFVAPAQLSFRSFDQFYAEPPQRRIFIIKNGKTDPEHEAVKANTLSIIERALLTMIKNHHLGDIYRIFRMAKDDDVDFNVVGVPNDFRVRAREAFDTHYLAKLFDVGFRQGEEGGRWQKSPPEFRPMAPLPSSQAVQLRPAMGAP